MILPSLGEYEILAWTELEEDSDVENDTARVTITNIPIITSYPYFEDFEIWKGGWTVGDESKASSWEYGKPDGTQIPDAVSGDNAWVTNLSGPYNDSEFSLLLSPCLDFSSLNQDPRIAFSLNINTESCCDEAWLEVSIDGGENWTKVGSAGTGYNWYNNAQENWWSGDGGIEGWSKVYQELTGTAGQEDVRVRFVFSSDFEKGEEGVGIDDIFISAPLQRDAAALDLGKTSDFVCGVNNDQVVFTFANFGQASFTQIVLNYQVNNGPVISETLTGPLVRSEEQFTYTFNDSFNSSIPGQYEIKAWTSLNGDLFARNDTLVYRFATAIELPFQEDFETGLLPPNWTFDDEANVTDAHANTSFVLSNNMWNGDASFEAVSPVFGPILLGDSLVFDYRFVDLAGEGSMATALGASDQLAIQISSDCGENYQTVFVIDQSNHLPTTELEEIGINLESYLGSYINIRFLATWGEGDYYLDIDNVNVPRCVGSLDLEANLKGISSIGASDGSIRVTPTLGTPPYAYSWSTGATGPFLTNLAEGEYQVLVTDRFGCTDQSTFNIGLVVDVDQSIPLVEQVNLFPNPTTGSLSVEFMLENPKSVNLELIDLTGRILDVRRLEIVQQNRIELDYRHLPKGIYLARFLIGEQPLIKKLVIN